MDGLTTALTIAALDGLTARSEATAENIANAQTRGYRPVRVSFEQALAAAAVDGPAAVRAVQPSFSREVGPAASDLRLDLELATASSTAARYAALVEVLSRRMQIDGLAVSGGR